MTAFTASARKRLAAAIAAEMQRMVDAGTLRPYDEPHERGRSIYVLRLDDDVYDCPRCKRLFPDIDDRRTAFYVGSTGNPVEVRLAQHRAYASHDQKKEKMSSWIAPHIVQREVDLEPHFSGRNRSLEQRIKWAAEMRELEEAVIPTIIRSAGFAVYAGRATNADGTWKKRAKKRKPKATRSRAAAKA